MAFQGLKSDLDVLQTSYTPFTTEEGAGDTEDSDNEDSAPPQFSTREDRPRPLASGQQAEGDTPFGHDPGVMIQMVPESGKSKWSHIDDLDSFFTKVYEYHQKHGFTVMMLQELLELIQFIFIIFFTVFLFECIDYPLLFKDKLPDGYKGDKIHLAQVVQWKGVMEMAFLTKWFIVVSVAFWVTRAIVVVYHVFQFWDIKCFFNTALRISDQDLDSITWWDVQKRLVAAQAEHMMCIHKEELTELDVYHRILRFNNYLVAMVNKSLLPLRFNLPFMGDYVFLSSGLKFNLELILFKSPWAPFNQWHLREDYKRVAKRKELSDALQNRILILGCINLILMPVILLWQILYSFFNYAEVIKREPGSLGVRKWSLYGKLYLRHLNELDHELSARLSWAYKPATYYMDIFVSPLATVIAKNVAFVCGSVLAVLILLTVWDEDVLNVEHVLTIMTVLGACVAGARVFIPDENLVFCPEKTLSQVISHIHYFPEDWKGKAHTYKVMNELGLLFPYTAVYLLEELLSPVITPFVLVWHLRYKSQDIVDFFRNFTVDVVGVGDVCSFAQMDVRRHGHPNWQADLNPAPELGGDQVPLAKTNHYTQGEDGKTEMSLVHFTLTNPGWKPSLESERYLTGLRTCAERDVQQMSMLPEGESLDRNPMYESLNALSNNNMAASSNSSSSGLGYGRGGGLGVVGGTAVPSPPPTSIPSPLNQQQESQTQQQLLYRGGISRLPGPLLLSSSQSMLRSRLPATPSNSLLISGLPPPPSSSFLNSGLPPPSSYLSEYPGVEYATADMNLSALYLHNIQHRHARGRIQHIGEASGYAFQRQGEAEPLIRDLSS